MRPLLLNGVLSITPVETAKKSRAAMSHKTHGRPRFGRLGRSPVAHLDGRVDANRSGTRCTIVAASGCTRSVRLKDVDCGEQRTVGVNETVAELESKLG
jgi:hypothetical protein